MAEAKAKTIGETFAAFTGSDAYSQRRIDVAFYAGAMAALSLVGAGTHDRAVMADVLRWLDEHWKDAEDADPDAGVH